MSELAPIGVDPWTVERPERRRVTVDEADLLDALLCASLAADLLPVGLPLRGRLLGALTGLSRNLSPDLRRLLHH